MSPEQMCLEEKPVVFRSQRSMREALDAWGATQCMSRSGAIRELLKRGLQQQNAWPIERTSSMT